MTTLHSSGIEYKVLVSSRAKRMRLRVEPFLGVTVTVPKRFPIYKVSEFVAANDDWIRQQLHRIDSDTPEIYQQWPPRCLDLRSQSRIVAVTLDPLQNTDCLIEKDRVSLKSTSENKRLIVHLIAQFLIQESRQLLAPKVARFAERYQLDYRRIQIRGQKTVWGSYSSRGTLSLNFKLLFLPADLVDYVVIHELVHSRFLDHSPRFWALLEDCLPGAKQLDMQLKQAGSMVPPWLELAR